MKPSLLILLPIFVTQMEYSVVISLRDEKQGYCTTVVRKSRSIPYVETYQERTWGIFYKTKYRTNYYTEYYTAWRTEERCCFLYEKHNDECVPVCFRDCGNGDCVKPNTCSCHRGYAETGLSVGPICVADCDHPCVHGRCTDPNVCTCDTGYQLMPDGFTCEPVCQPNCDRKNAVCSAPDTCSCRDGYTKFGYTTCIPKCTAPCVNGRCTAPDTCTCKIGYTIDLNDRFTCNPICDKCVGGTCTAPGVCTCNEGYSLSDDGVCEPVCSQLCHMGTCVAPETCMCHEGYGFLNNSTNVCEPVCPKACINGFCSKPNVCECHEGYDVTGDETSLHVCKPRCNIPCGPNGACTEPNVCTCDPGYTLADQSDGPIYFGEGSLCKPMCAEECVNGFCGMSGTCVCYIGYERSDDVNVCKPYCFPSCWPHSTCTEPLRCTCDEGYQLKVGSNNATDTCEPICDQECINGFCSAPGECSCNVGYTKFDATEPNICGPICEPSCDSHSNCTAPDVCTCEEGYNRIRRQDPSWSHFYLNDSCEPICKQECVNGFCSSPGDCSCNSGYVEIEANVCEPVCELPCWQFSSCTAPEVCTCDAGYDLVTNEYNSSRCEPICQPSCPSNGICERPGLCICKEGYRSLEENESPICEPICDFSCNNGTCTSPNICSCDVGYANDESGSCIPHCTIDCGNGTCIEPDICNCDEGYALNNESQTCEPYCENNCDHGDCVAPNDCRCNVGFLKNGTNNDSICVSACKDACNEKGDCIDDRGNCNCYYGWSGSTCEEPTFCSVIVFEEYQTYERLSIVKELNNSILLASATNPTCQQCLNEVNNETICYEFLYDDIGGHNYSAICLVDASSMCYATHSPTREVVKVSVAVGGVAVLIMIISIAVACFKFKKQKRTVVIGKSSGTQPSILNLLSEENTNL